MVTTGGRRMCYCKCQTIGCEWQGTWKKLQEHEDKCEFLSKSSEEILQCLQAREATKQPPDMEQAKLSELFSVGNVSFAGYLSALLENIYNTMSIYRCAL